MRKRPSAKEIFEEIERKLAKVDHDVWRMRASLNHLPIQLQIFVDEYAAHVRRLTERDPLCYEITWDSTIGRPDFHAFLAAYGLGDVLRQLKEAGFAVEMQDEKRPESELYSEKHLFPFVLRIDLRKPDGSNLHLVYDGTLESLEQFKALFPGETRVALAPIIIHLPD